MQDYHIFLATKNETWQEALARFDRFIDAQMLDFFSNKTYPYRFVESKAYVYRPTGKIGLSYFDTFTEETQVRVPNVLIKLLTQHGTFTIGDGLLRLFPPNPSGNIILTLPKVLEHYGYNEFTKKIGSGMLKSLSGFYFFFGATFTQSHEMSFLYFSKAGHFGKMLFAPDNPALVLQKVLPSMFNGSIDRYTLDSLISNQIDRIVTNALMVKGYLDSGQPHQNFSGID